MARNDTTPRHIRSIWPPLLLFALSAGYVVWAQRYGFVPRLVPTIMGTATAILCLIDLVSRLDTALGRAVRVAMGADFDNREMAHDPPVRSEAGQILWMVGCILLMLFIGILPTVPLFILAYMVAFGRRPRGQSLLSALLVFGFVYVVFELLLDYELYRGALFDSAGIAGW